MAEYIRPYSQPERPSLDFFEYWESLGFFENLQVILPPRFLIIFEIARVIFTPELISDALSAVEDISKEEKIEAPDRDESILINRLDRVSPLSDNMELDNYRTIYDLKKALPRELTWESDIFNMKLMTRTLMVTRFYESDSDQFRPISTTRDETGRDATRFDQKFFLLLDRSRSMDFKMRSFFSKCLVAEFLRRKINSNAKIFYRPFDSTVGKLFKLEKKEDFARLIEDVLFTTTGGTSTNLQEAIFQAISDIRYDKEMINSEILVITDGISKIEKFKLKERLGDIKLNVLKIGDDLAEANFYDMKETLDSNRIDFDPSSVNIKEIQKKLKKGSRDDSNLTPTEKRAYRYLLDYSERMFKDLREVSQRFVEIPDLEPSNLFKLTDETLDFIETTADEFVRMDFENKSLDERQKIYKQIYFLCQYIELLMDYGDNDKNPVLHNAYEKLLDVRRRMLSEPSLMQVIVGVKGYDDDKKALKLSRREVKKRLNEMEFKSKTLSKKEMKKAQMVMTMDVGEGSMGQFLMLILIKLWEFFKRVARAPFGKKTKDDE